MNWSLGKSSLAEVVEESLQALMSGKNSTEAAPALDSYGRPIQNHAQAPQPQVQPPQVQPKPQTQPQQQPQPQASPVAAQIPQATAAPSAYPNATPLYANPFGPPANSAAGHYGAPAAAAPVNSSYAMNNAQPTNQAHMNNNSNPYGLYPVIPGLGPNGNQVSPTAAQGVVGGFGGYAAVGPSPAMGYGGQAAVQQPVYSSSAVGGFPSSGGYGMRSNNSDPNLAYLSKPPALEQFENSNKSNNGNNSAGNSLKGPAINPVDNITFDEEARSPIPIPDIPLQFPELEKLTDVQLNRLLTDEVALLAQANSVDSVGTTKSLRDQLRQANHDRASKNVLMVNAAFSFLKHSLSLSHHFVSIVLLVGRDHGITT